MSLTALMLFGWSTALAQQIPSTYDFTRHFIDQTTGKPTAFTQNQRKALNSLIFQAIKKESKLREFGCERHKQESEDENCERVRAVKPEIDRELFRPGSAP